MKPLDLNIDFMSKAKIALVVSTVIVVAAVIDLFAQGLNFGLDFTGGTMVELRFQEPVDPAEVRTFLETRGFENGTVQFFGSDRDLLVRMPPQSADEEQAGVADAIVGVLRGSYPEVELSQSNFVGPAVGEELREDAALALLAALVVIMVYILFRFTKQFAVAVVAGQAHDAIVVVGLFSLFQWTFDLSVMAAVLAVVGYSLNDSIVVSDRIRENFRKLRRATPREVINRSLNEVLGRTLVTSLSTLLVLVTLLIAGGETLRNFALALTIGVVVGTYSSIYVTASMLLVLKVRREDLMVPEKEDAEQERPIP